jgi:hypothetical protein
MGGNRMGLWDDIKKLVLDWGEHDIMRERAKSKYKPLYNGHWVNKGTFDNENWIWKEDRKVVRIRPLYVCVFEMDTDFIIMVCQHPKDMAVGVVQCEDDVDVERAIIILKASYSVLGNVIINKEEQE